MTLSSGEKRTLHLMQDANVYSHAFCHCLKKREKERLCHPRLFEGQFSVLHSPQLAIGTGTSHPHRVFKFSRTSSVLGEKAKRQRMRTKLQSSILLAIGSGPRMLRRDLKFWRKKGKRLEQSDNASTKQSGRTSYILP